MTDEQRLILIGKLAHAKALIVAVRNEKTDHPIGDTEDALALITQVSEALAAYGA